MSPKHQKHTQQPTHDRPSFAERFNSLFLKPGTESNDSASPAQLRKYQWGSYALVAFGLESLILAAYEYPHQNYFHDGWLVLTLFLSGAMIGVVCAVVLKYFSPGLAAYKWNGGTMTAWTFCVMTFASLGWGMFLNSYDVGYEREQFCVAEQWYRKGYHVKLVHGEHWVNCRFGRSFYNSHNVGDSVSVWVHHGLLGFDYVSQD